MEGKIMFYIRKSDGSILGNERGEPYPDMETVEMTLRRVITT